MARILGCESGRIERITRAQVGPDVGPYIDEATGDGEPTAQAVGSPK
jgi:hypothetical protein